MRDTPLRFWPTFARLFKYLLLAVLLTLTGFLSAWWKTSYDAEERMRFEEYTEEIVRDIIRRLHSNHFLLQGTGGVLAHSNETTRAEWKAYCDYLQLDVHYPGILGLGFSQAISPSDLVRHIEEIRATGYPDYTVWPAGNRDAYTSIIFLEPFDATNRHALGYDMFSEPVRRAAMERARDTGEVAISGPVQLVQKDGTGHLSGFLMYRPFYAGGIVMKDVAGRRANLKGYVYAPIRLGELIQKIFPELNEKVTFEIYGGTEVSSSTLLYSSTGSSGVPQETSKPRLSSRKTIEIYGSRWTLVFACQDAFLSVSGRYTLVSFLVSGVFLSLFAFLFLRGLETAHDREISMASEKTTALEQSEAKYRALNDSLPIGVSIIGPQMEVLAANATTHKWFPEMAVGANSQCPATCSLPSEAKPHEWQLVNRSFSDRQTHTMEREVVTALGKRILFFTASPLFDSDGKVGSVHMTAEDITDRRLAENEKARLEGKLRQLKKTESLSRLAGAVAHHFNNRLHGVLGYLELSMDDIKLGIMPAENIEAATDSARQAADLGALMLTYLGESIISTTDVDLAIFCESTFAELQKKSPENISFEHTTSAVPVPVKANPGQLRQVITSLYTNAVEAIGAREGVIRTAVCVVGRDVIASVNRYPVDWEAEEILYGSFEITDNGSGIDRADLERIFDPFFSTRFTGRGLGLAVALGIIKNHGGGMTVASEQGKGSSFKFYLPLH